MEHKKLIQITEKDWHYRLIKFCWGIDPKMFKNLCPYFWLSIASIFTFIPVVVYKLLKNFFKAVGNGLINLLDRMMEGFSSYNYERFISSLSNGQIYYICNRDDHSKTWEGDDLVVFFGLKKITGKTFNEMADDVLKIRHFGKDNIKSFKDDYSREVALAKKMSAEREEKRRVIEENARKKAIEDAEKIKKREKEMKAFVNNVSMVTKEIFKWIGIAFVGALSFIATFLFSWLFINGVFKATYVDWISVLKSTGIIIGSTIGALTIGFLIIYSTKRILKAFDRIDEYEGIKKYIVNTLYNITNWILTGAYWFGMIVFYYPFYIFLWKIVIVGVTMGFIEGFNEFGGIFADYFNASYSDYCPGIEWESEGKNK